MGSKAAFDGCVRETRKPVQNLRAVRLRSKLHFKSSPQDFYRTDGSSKFAGEIVFQNDSDPLIPLNASI